MEALEGRLVLLNGLTTEEHGLTNTIIHKVFQAKPLTDKQQQMLDTRRDNGEPIPAPSKYKAYKGGVTQVMRKGVDTMVDVLYEDLDEEKTHSAEPITGHRLPKQRPQITSH